MIIKTLRCKKRDFRRLVQYVLCTKKLSAHIDEIVDFERTFCVTQHLHSAHIGGIIDEFKANDRYRKERKNGVVMYHEILSWHEKDSPHLNVSILEDIVRHYIQLRAPDSLCLAVPHFDKGHKHIHLLFSGTEYKSAKTLRMDNRQFKTLRQGIERYQQEKYPHIRHSHIHTKERAIQPQKSPNTKGQNKERVYHTKKRSQKALDKEHLSDIAQEALKQTTRTKDFFKYLKNKGLELYQYRTKIAGVFFNNRKYRFSTLGIGKKDLDRLQQKEEQIKQRLVELDDLKTQRKQRQLDRSEQERGTNSIFDTLSPPF